MSVLRIAWHQQNPEWEKPEINLQTLTDVAPRLGECDVWILPEMFATGFTMNLEMAKSGLHALEWMKQMAKEREMVLAGSLAYPGAGGPVNRFFWVNSRGEAVHYDKRNLFELAGETKHFMAGNQRVLLSFRGWNIALFVCYDLRFGAWMYRRPHFNYDLALVVANWPERRSRAWKTLLSARAIENQCYVLGVNRVGTDGNGLLYSGDSRLIGPLGDSIIENKVFEAENGKAVIDLEELQEVRRRFPFWTGGLDE